MPDSLSPEKKLELLGTLEKLVEFKFRRVIGAVAVPGELIRIPLSEFAQIGVDLHDDQNPASRLAREHIEEFLGIDPDGKEVRFSTGAPIPKNLHNIVAVAKALKATLLVEIVADDLEEVFTQLQPCLGWDDVPTFPNPLIRGHNNSLQTIPDIQDKMTRYKKDIRNARRAAIREREESIAGENPTNIDTAPERPRGNAKAHKKGRPTLSNEESKRRKKIADAWNTNEYQNKSQLAEEFGISTSDAKKAIDYCRKQDERKRPRK